MLQYMHMAPARKKTASTAVVKRRRKRKPVADTDDFSVGGGEYSEGLRTLEDMVRVHAKHERVEGTILGFLGVVGLFAVVALAPNVAGLLAKALPDGKPTSQRQSVKRAIIRLIKKGYIRKEGGRYALTRDGTLRLEMLKESAQIQLLFHTRPPEWDGKWRIVIFDIKESLRHVRDELRSLLTQTGFTMLQGSVWVYPFRCDEVVALLKFHLRLGYDLVYVVADAIEGDEYLREYYNLPPQ